MDTSEESLKPSVAAKRLGVSIKALRLYERHGLLKPIRTADLQPAGDVRVAFDLPWPWGGERFELRDIRRLNYIIGPLGSGKTRLALAIAEHLPDAVLLAWSASVWPKTQR